MRKRRYENFVFSDAEPNAGNDRVLFCLPPTRSVSKDGTKPFGPDDDGRSGKDIN